MEVRQHRKFLMGPRGRFRTSSGGAGSDGNPVRYQWGAADGMRKERAIFAK